MQSDPIRCLTIGQLSRIEADKVQIDNVDWEAVLKKPEQLVVRGSVTADVINAENATVNGKCCAIPSCLAAANLNLNLNLTSKLNC